MDTNESMVRGRGRPSQYSAEQIGKAMDMIRTGSTLKAAAEAAGMTIQNVMYYKRKQGVAGATVPGIMPTTVSDPLALTETTLVSKYDTEIQRLEATIERASARLKETVTKRRRVAKALGLITEETPAAE